MITLENCKKILNSKERKYTDEEIKMIRAYLYVMEQIQLEIENNDTNTKEE